MRTTLITLAAGVVAALTASLTLPAAIAQAATTAVTSVPAPQKSLTVAGYEQFGCRYYGYPKYVQILGTITVPTATDPTGTPGISSDYYGIGGVALGGSNTVSGGVSLDNSDGQAFYLAYGDWDGRYVTASFSVQPGDKLQVTIEDEGSSGWLVELFNDRTGQEWAQTNPASVDQCQAGAFEESAYPNWDYLTQTTPVAFDFSRVLWGEQGQGLASVSKLLGAPPAHALLFRFNMINTSGSTVAKSSKPTDSDNNFTVTDG